VDEGTIPLPTVRTIGRILARRGALDGRRRTRHPAPQKGWYLPDLISELAELDSFDIVEGLIIRSGFEVEVLNVSSLLGGLCGSLITAKMAVKCIIEHWRRVRLPDYAQFDNNTIFQARTTGRTASGGSSDCVWAWMWFRCLLLPKIRDFRPPSRTITAAGRRRSGTGSNMPATRNCGNDRMLLWTLSTTAIEPVAIRRRSDGLGHPLGR